MTLPTTPHRFIQGRWPWLAASLALTAGLFVFTTLGWYWYAGQRASAARQLSLDLLWIEQVIAQSLEADQKVLGNWAHDLSPASPKSTSDFLSRADGLMKANPALVAIDYLDRNGRRVSGLPEYGERPDRLPPVNDPLIAEAIQRSATLKTASYSRVIEQYAPLWVLAVPVSDDATNQGVVLVTYDLDQLLSREVPWWFVQRYDLRLVDRNNKQLSPRDGGAPDVDADIHKLAFGPSNSGLALWASPHTGSRADIRLTLLSTAVVLFGLLIVWLLRVLQRWLRERQAAANTARERDELLQHTARLSSLAEFASGIAHELNQPLAAIANYSAAADSFLDSDPPQMQKVQEAVRRLGEESRRAGQIIHSMRSFIQKRTVQHETHKLSALLDGPLALLAPLAQRLGTAITVEGGDQRTLIECDAIMIEQVLFNLLRNALEAVATQARGAAQEAVVLRIARDADSVTVSVCDRGPGIADIDKLFQPFYTTKSEGMGLGLAICRTVIESHGGRLWGENNPGGGACFSFRLPCTVAA